MTTNSFLISSIVPNGTLSSVTTPVPHRPKDTQETLNILLRGENPSQIALALMSAISSAQLGKRVRLMFAAQGILALQKPEFQIHGREVGEPTTQTRLTLLVKKAIESGVLFFVCAMGAEGLGLNKDFMKTRSYVQLNPQLNSLSQEFRPQNSLVF